MTSETEIIACVDGPLLVRGDIDLVSSTGEPIERNRRTIALCRCGASLIKPFCDGSHKMVRFVTEPEPDSESKRESEPDQANLDGQ